MPRVKSPPLKSPFLRDKIINLGEFCKRLNFENFLRNWAQIVVDLYRFLVNYPSWITCNYTHHSALAIDEEFPVYLARKSTYDRAPLGKPFEAIRST